MSKKVYNPLVDQMVKEAKVIEKKAKLLDPNEKLGYYANSLTRDEVIILHIRITIKTVNKYVSEKYAFEDLFSIATIGAIKAYDTFNPERGTKFLSYAGRCMENEIRMFLRVERKKESTISLDEKTYEDKDGNTFTIADSVGDERVNLQDEVEVKLMLKQALNIFGLVLSSREKEVLILRTGIDEEKKTQQEVADKMNISRSYVSRIEKIARKKLLKEFSQPEKRLQISKQDYVSKHNLQKPQKTQQIQSLGFIQKAEYTSKAEVQPQVRSSIEIKSNSLIQKNADSSIINEKDKGQSIPTKMDKQEKFKSIKKAKAREQLEFYINEFNNLGILQQCIDQLPMDVKNALIDAIGKCMTTSQIAKNYNVKQETVLVRLRAAARIFGKIAERELPLQKEETQKKKLRANKVSQPEGENVTAKKSGIRILQKNLESRKRKQYLSPNIAQLLASGRLEEMLLRIDPKEAVVIKLLLGLEDGVSKTQKQVADILKTHQCIVSALMGSGFGKIDGYIELNPEVLEEKGKGSEITILEHNNARTEVNLNIQESQKNDIEPLDKMQYTWSNVDRLKRMSNQPASIIEFKKLIDQAASLGILSECMGIMLDEERAAIVYYSGKQNLGRKTKEDKITYIFMRWWFRSAAQKFRDVMNGVPVPQKTTNEKVEIDSDHQIIQISEHKLDKTQHDVETALTKIKDAIKLLLLANKAETPIKGGSKQLGTSETGLAEEVFVPVDNDKKKQVSKEGEPASKIKGMLLEERSQMEAIEEEAIRLRKALQERYKALRHKSRDVAF